MKQKVKNLKKYILLWSLILLFPVVWGCILYVFYILYATLIMKHLLDKKKTEQKKIPIILNFWIKHPVMATEDDRIRSWFPGWQYPHFFFSMELVIK